MNPPMDDIELNPEKLEEEKDSGPLFHCDLCDTDIIYKIAQAFLPGLASACIDNTTGGLLKSPASVAVDIRREMVDYLIQRSENFVAESVVLEGGPGVEVPDNPYDIIADSVDDFVSSKRNFFSRVSGWLLSERREDRIDDLVQEMEINGFWLLNRRTSVAQTLLKNVDFKDLYHCNNNFRSREELEEHKLNCGFRTVACDNEGCNSRFSKAQADYHDSICPFKILPCDQKCSDSIMRRDMDRHCLTICLMKLVKCPFYSVGCQCLVPQCQINEHRSDNLRSHMLCVLHTFHKEASAEDLRARSEELEKSFSPGELASYRDARALTNAIKGPDAKLGPIITKKIEEPMEEDANSGDEKESKDLPIKEVDSDDSPKIKEKSNVNSPSDSPKIKEKGNVNSPSDSPKIKERSNVNSPSKADELKYVSHAKEELVESQPNKEEPVVSKQESPKESPIRRDESPRSPIKLEMQMGQSTKEAIDPADLHTTSPIKHEDHTESIGDNEKHEVQSSKEEASYPAEKHHTSPTKREEHVDSIGENEKHAESSSSEEEDNAEPVNKQEKHAESSSSGEEEDAESNGERKKHDESSLVKENEHVESIGKREDSESDADE